MEVSEMNNPSHEQKTSNALKANRVIHVSRIQCEQGNSGRNSSHPVPKLDDSPESSWFQGH